MKSLYFLSAILLGSFAMCSCTKTFYSHQQMLQKCKTKDDVLKQFGPPDERNPGNGLEQWVYNMDKDSVRNPPKKNLITKLPDTLVKDSVQRIAQEKYVRYLKFMFDDQGKVIGYKAEGVDLGRKVKDNFGTSLLTITGGIVVASVLIALQLYSDGAIDP